VRLLVLRVRVPTGYEIVCPSPSSPVPAILPELWRHFGDGALPQCVPCIQSESLSRDLVPLLLYVVYPQVATVRVTHVVLVVETLQHLPSHLIRRDVDAVQCAQPSADPAPLRNAHVGDTSGNKRYTSAGRHTKEAVANPPRKRRRMAATASGHHLSWPNMSMRGRRARRFTSPTKSDHSATDEPSG